MGVLDRSSDDGRSSVDGCGTGGEGGGGGSEGRVGFDL